MIKNKKGFTWIVIAIGILGVILFSAKAVMVKLAYQYNVTAVNLLMFRMLFSLPFYVLVLLFTKKSEQKQGKKEYLWLVVFGIIGYYLASYFDFIGLQYIKASIERIILFIYPTIVVLLSRIFLKRPITKVQLMAILLTYFGVVVSFWDELGIEGSQFLLGATFIFLSALTYASYLTGSDWLIPKFGVTRFTSYAMIISCGAVVLHYLIFEHTTLLGYNANVYWLGLGMALLSTVIPSYLVSYCIKEIGASNFAILGGLGPISTIILASIFLGERLTMLQLGGTLLVIVGIIAISLNKSTYKKSGS
ncbi:DMT family transporter [Galbibacter pacificus]|uniref:DMT family transporter n=1 Tax=Galbibacter pacificus TaxID=2996052 RepID=A0ABT6FQ79_9FLAO|nr:DMT family transporter [Galbibacter pacificus]MDG3582105.1 DMT family transporter [Galbibacter pacificus]MDG3585419.1 DMT family transporter [Galbibacter pacificus]